MVDVGDGFVGKARDRRLMLVTAKEESVAVFKGIKTAEIAVSSSLENTSATGKNSQHLNTTTPTSTLSASPALSPNLIRALCLIVSHISLFL